VTPSRRLAWEILLAVEEGAHAADLLDARLTNAGTRDAGLVTEIVFGVLRRRAQLDFLLEQPLGRRVADLDTEVRNALYLGAYQLRFLDRIPAHSAVHESVEIVKRSRVRSAAGLVNAALRRLPVLPADWPNDAVRYSMPTWLLRRWTENFGDTLACRIANAALRAPETYVRVPPGSPLPEGLDLCRTDVEGCFRAPGAVPSGLRRQDIGSQSIVPLLDLAPGLRFADICAAPGNKTMQALEAGVRAVACDISAHRLRTVPPVCPRVQLDASEPLPFRAEFDRILVDVPCSGTGTLSRNPEIRWRLTPEDLARHHCRQTAILRAALDCLRPGGRLVYATCSLEPEENMDVVRAVAAHRIQQTMERLPGRDEGEGFFAAVLSSG
jgi:16S rRNA (cytosine967-C5)-methyltransferase